MGDYRGITSQESEKSRPTAAPAEPAVRRSRPSRPSRRRSYAIVAVAAVILALAIFGGYALMDPVGDVGDPVEIGGLSESDAAYEDALALLESGETTAAIEALERALELNPANSAAQRTLADVRAQQQAEEPGDSGGEMQPGGQAELPPPAPDDDPQYNDGVADLLALLPSAVSGYSLGTPVGAAPDVTVSGTPTSPQGTVSLVLWSIHERPTLEEAFDYIESTSKVAYPRDPAVVTVDGFPAYFGTDGTRFATITYVRGRYVFEVILTSTSGAPAGERSVVEEAAQAFAETE